MRVSKKEYIKLAKEFIDLHKYHMIQRYKRAGYVDLELMVIDTANALKKYDPDYKNIDTRDLYEFIIKELNNTS